MESLLNEMNDQLDFHQKDYQKQILMELAIICWIGVKFLFIMNCDHFNLLHFGEFMFYIS
jgi:hypothetical protein